MQEQEFIKIPRAELDSLRQRIQQLQQQVEKLRFQSLYVRDSNHRHSSLIYGHPKKQRYVCEQCKKLKQSKSSSNNNFVSTPNKLKQELKGWSKDFKIKKQPQQCFQQVDALSDGPDQLAQQSPRVVKKIQMPLSSQLKKAISIEKKQSKKREPRLFQKVCLFGPSQQGIFEQSSKTFTVPYQMYAPEEEFDQFSVYGNYIFPQQVSVKRVRQAKAPTQINRVIFKKSSKRQQTSVLILMGQQHHPLLQPSYENKLLQFCNPGKKLYAFSINFTDFLSYTSEDLKFNSTAFKNLNRTGSGFDTTVDFNQTMGAGSVGQFDKQYEINKVFLSKFCITIFTYFPLVNLIEKLLLKIMEEIKIKRLQSFTQKQASTNQIDIKFIVRQLNIISQKLMKQLTSFYPQLNNTGTFAIGDQMIQILLSKDQVHQQMYGGWAYNMMKPLNKDLALQILTHIIFQESICFICEDLYFLTFFILLFTDFLLRPLVYPYKHVSVMFDQDLLGAPIIVVLGVNKTTDWLQQNLKIISQTKVIVDLNDQVYVKSKKKKKIPKSDKVKKLMNFFYKWAQIGQSPFATKRRQAILKPCSGQQNQIMLNFSRLFYEYLNEQILSHLPIPQIIIPMKSLTGNTSSMCSSILKAVEKYFVESRKKKQKDQFIDLIAKHQIFYLLVGTKYGIM